MTLTEFLVARIGEIEDCEGVGEYRGCHDLSAWADRAVAAMWGIAEAHAAAERDLMVDRYAWREALQLIAEVYAEHPDYREEWRP